MLSAEGEEFGKVPRVKFQAGVSGQIDRRWFRYFGPSPGRVEDSDFIQKEFYILFQIFLLGGISLQALLVVVDIVFELFGILRPELLFKASGYQLMPKIDIVL